MAAAEDEPREKAAAVMQQAECGDTQILICYDVASHARRAVLIVPPVTT